MPSCLASAVQNDNASQIRSSTSSTPPSSGPPFDCHNSAQCSAFYISFRHASVARSNASICASAYDYASIAVCQSHTACLSIAATLRTASAYSVLYASCKLTPQGSANVGSPLTASQTLLCLSGAKQTSIYTRSQEAAHGSHHSNFTNSNHLNSQKCAYAPAAHARILGLAFRSCSQFLHSDCQHLKCTRLARLACLLIQVAGRTRYLF